MMKVMKGLVDLEFERLYNMEVACIDTLMVTRREAAMVRLSCNHARNSLSMVAGWAAHATAVAGLAF